MDQEAKEHQNLNAEGPCILAITLLNYRLTVAKFQIHALNRGSRAKSRKRITHLADSVLLERKVEKHTTGSIQPTGGAAPLLLAK
jgi:hypothetical protein